MDVFRFTIVVLKEGSGPKGNLHKIIGPMFPEVAEFKFPLIEEDFAVCTEFL